MTRAVDRLTRAIREEIVRQYRDDERNKCPAGATFYEEHVAPHQIALVALKVISEELDRERSERQPGLIPDEGVEGPHR